VRTFRAVTGIFSFALAVLAAAYVLGDAAVRAGWQSMVLLAPWVLLVLWALFVIGPASTIRMDDVGVRVQNMLRRTDFGWKRLRDVDLRWQVVFALDDGTEVTSFGGPARARPRRVPGSVVGDTDHAPARSRVPAGYRELTEIRDRWESADAAADAPIRRSWDRPALIALATIAVWAIVAVIVAQG
jgi:hypothetical protein